MFTFQRYKNINTETYVYSSIRSNWKSVSTTSITFSSVYLSYDCFRIYQYADISLQSMKRSENVCLLVCDCTQTHSIVVIISIIRTEKFCFMLTRKRPKTAVLMKNYACKLNILKSKETMFEL
jgi:hypothetical protein